MALPRTLKNFNVYGDGNSYRGLVPSITLPKLTRKTDEYRAGGMNAPIEDDMGMEKLELSYTKGGFDDTEFRSFGAATVDANMVRFSGAYQQADTGLVDAVDVIVRGRIKELDSGDAKPGDRGEQKQTLSLSYYKLVVNGRTIVEIDVLAMIEIVDGVDMLAAQRAAAGL